LKKDGVETVNSAASAAYLNNGINLTNRGRWFQNDVTT